MSISKLVTDAPNLHRLLTALEPMQRAAYEQGWRDAVAAITRSANTLLAPPTAEQYARRISLNGAKGEAPAADTHVGRILAVVVATRGMTGAEVVKAVRQAGHDIASESIRASLHRLKKRRLVEQRDHKWFASGVESNAVEPPIK